MYVRFEDSRAATACWRALLSCFSLFLGMSFSTSAQGPELLEPDKAFRISTRAIDERHVEVRFQIADGYYMYRDRFRFETEQGQLLADAEFPKGQMKNDEFFGMTETYRREVRIRVPISAADANRGSVRLKVTSQGCADVGVCYVPLVQVVDVSLAGGVSKAPERRFSPLQSPFDGLLKAPREDQPVAPRGAPNDAQPGSMR